MFDLLEASSISCCICSDGSSRAASIVTTHHRQTLDAADRDLGEAYELYQSEGGPEDEGRERERGKGRTHRQWCWKWMGLRWRGGWHIHHRHLRRRNDEELRRDLLKLVDSRPEAISVEEAEWTRTYGLVLSDLSPSLSHHPCLPHSLPTNWNWD